MTTSSLMGLLRLAHGVLDFLVKQPEERVLAFTQGHTQLAFVSPATAIPHQPSPEPAPTPAPEPATHPMPETVWQRAPESEPRPVPRPSPPPRPKPSPSPGSQTGMSDEAAAAIAEQLRACATEAEGLTILNRAATNNAARRAVATALNVEVTRSMTSDHLKTLILRHAIGARRTFAGLSSW